MGMILVTTSKQRVSFKYQFFCDPIDFHLDPLFFCECALFLEFCFFVIPIQNIKSALFVSGGRGYPHKVRGALDSDVIGSGNKE